MTRERGFPSMQHEATATPDHRWRIPLSAVAIVGAGLIAYRHSFVVPFFFDDVGSIVDNPTIRNLSDLGQVLSPPRNSSGVSGRPLINLTLAVNYALGGTHVWGYHALNLIFHLLGGLTLFGLVRRISSRLPGSWPPTQAITFGATAALLWTLHPLQTESVTCVAQRTELQVGLCYLFTLYCLVRSADAPQSRFWPVCAVVACLAGMASKEVMVTLPVIAFLFDRTFLAGTFREAWRQRGRLHLALASTWALLIFLVLQSSGSRGTAAGFGFGVTWYHYLFKQCEAVCHYLWLSVWPHPLIVDYGSDLVLNPFSVAPQGLLLIALFGATIAALWYRPVWGFLGAWFFVILGPSSSVVPLVSQTMAEHRMYLPLAAVTTLLAWLLVRVLGSRGTALVTVLPLAFVILTDQRTRDYRTEPTIWTDNVLKRPSNARGWINLGNLEFQAGKPLLAIQHYQVALRLAPADADAHANLATALRSVPGHEVDVIAHYEAALQLRPIFPEIHISLGTLLLKEPARHDEALAHFETGLRQDAYYVPRSMVASAHFGAGVILAAKPERHEEAITHYRAAIAINPDYREAHYNLANLLATRRDTLADSVVHYQAALRLDPTFSQAHYNLGNVWMQLPGRLPQAAESLAAAVRHNPQFADAYYNLGLVWLKLGRADDAIAALDNAVRLRSADIDARLALATALETAGRWPEAETQAQAIINQAPGHAQALELVKRLKSRR